MSIKIICQKAGHLKQVHVVSRENLVTGTNWIKKSTKL
jgi:hypothetical protein